MLTPFRLSPIYKDYVWGGKRLRVDAERIAEAWIVSVESVVLDGPYLGQALSSVCKSEGEALLGSKVIRQSGKRFPLLIKLLDCADWLSLQVHPNNDQAAKLAGPDHLGKTEAWYVIAADDGAELISGFKPNVSCEDVQKAAGKKELLDLVERRPVQSGDTIFIAPGTIHALGPGLLIYELQQNSDITYRVYDWDRPLDGGRKLHINESIEVLNPNEKEMIEPFDKKMSSSPINNLATCQYFSLMIMQGNENSVRIDTKRESFAVITSVNSNIIIKGDEWAFKLGALETLFIPAECPPFEVVFEDEGKALLAMC